MISKSAARYDHLDLKAKKPEIRLPSHVALNSQLVNKQKIP